MIHAMKNLSIIGGLIVLAVAGAGRWSVDGRTLSGCAAAAELALSASRASRSRSG